MSATRLGIGAAAVMLAVALALLLAAPARAQLPAPALGETVNLEPVKGTVTTKCKGEGSATELTDAKQVAIPCVVDATDGTVKVTSATGVGDETQTAELRDGQFRVSQDPSDPTTVFKLVGPLTPGGAGEEGDEEGRKLWGQGNGNFETQGQSGTASLRGTTWLVEDLSNRATRVTVEKGVVDFFDAILGITVEVKAGESYTATPGQAVVPAGPIQNPTIVGYTDPDVALALGAQAGAGQAGAGPGALPFTGLDIGWLIGGGLVLIAAGAAMARYAPRSEPRR